MTPHMLSALTDADCRRELAHFLGHDLTPQAGCRITERIFGDATVLVEYERIPGEPRWFDPVRGVGHPGADDDIAILNVLINGLLCDADDVVPPTTLERWREELRDETQGDDGPDPDDAYDEWRDARRAA